MFIPSSLRHLFLLTVLIGVTRITAPCADLHLNEKETGTNGVPLNNPSPVTELCHGLRSRLLAFSTQVSLAGNHPLHANAGRPAKLKIRVAGAQIAVTNNVAANLATISRAIDFAVAEKADILLTPEGSLSGYTHDFDPEAVDQALSVVIRKAHAAKLALALGTCFEEPRDKQRYNEIRFFDQDGAYLGFHSKILLCRKVDGPATKSELDLYKTKPLQIFRVGGLTLGGLLCNDFWANPEWTPMDDPHLAQQLAKMGARIILLAVNGGPGKGEEINLTRQYHEANLRLRARAAGVWVVVVDNCGERNDLSCSAPCGVVDPEGKWVLRTQPGGEQLFAYTIEVNP